MTSGHRLLGSAVAIAVLAAGPTRAYDAGMDSPERFLRALYTELGGR